MSENLDITFGDIQPGVVVMKLEGAINTFTFEDLDKAFEELLAEGSHKIVVDMSLVTHVTSAGAGVFISAQDRFYAERGRVVLFDMRENVRGVMDMLGVLKVYTAFDNLNDALASLSK